MIGLQNLDFEESDRLLIGRFARRRDNDAFRSLMGRYADMVYTTCWRILGDEAEAADAAQDTFFELVKSADGITGSLGSWLHQVATRRAVDLIRQNVARRQREEIYAADAPCRSSSWSEVEPVVDEALEALPEDQRELLMRHFLQGRSTVQMAAAQGVSQPTISRRMAEALEGLRQNLRERGIQVGLVPLRTLLLHSNQVAPEALRSGLGIIALVKAAAANSAWLTGASVPATGIGLKTVVAAAAVVAVIATVGVIGYEQQKARPANPTRAPVAQGRFNAAAADYTPGRIDLTPIVRMSVAAAEPSQLCSIATNTPLGPGPARVSAPRPTAKSPPAARAPDTPAKGDRAVGTADVAGAQVLPAQWPMAAQPTPLIIVPRGYKGFYRGGLLIEADIYQPAPAAQLTRPDWNGGLHRPVTLGPGSAGGFVPAFGPSRLTMMSASKTDPGHGRPARGR